MTSLHAGSRDDKGEGREKTAGRMKERERREREREREREKWPAGISFVRGSDAVVFGCVTWVPKHGTVWCDKG